MRFLTSHLSFYMSSVHIGTINRPIPEQRHEGNENSSHVLCDWGFSWSMFCLLELHFVKPNDHKKAPLSKVVWFTWSVGLLEG